MGVIILKIIINRNEWLNIIKKQEQEKECETNRCGERDVVSGARDTASGRAGAVTDRQLLEVQPGQGGQGGQVASDGESGQYGQSISGFPDLVKVVVFF